MARYDAHLDKIIAAGVGDALKADGFRRQKPRLFTRREADRAVSVKFERDGKYGDEDCGFSLYVDFDAFEDLGLRLRANNREIRFIERSKWFLRHGHISVSDFGLARFHAKATPDGPHAFDLKFDRRRYDDKDKEAVTKFLGFRDLWAPTKDNIDEIAQEMLSLLRVPGQRWLGLMDDLSFAACWRLSEGDQGWGNFCLHEIDAAGLYHLAGDHERSRSLLRHLYDRRKVPFRQIEYRSRQDNLLFCLGKLRSTADSRQWGRRQFRRNQEWAETARLVADGLGYKLD